MANLRRSERKEAAPTTGEPRLFAGGWLTSHGWSWIPQSLFIIGIGFWIFGPSVAGGWVWDDDRYIASNSVIQSPEGYWKVWLHADSPGNYYPLTSLVQWIQWHLWGDDTVGYHLTNLALHLTSAFLLWRLFFRMGLPLAWVGAVFFTVHPAMVESVAWISELKNTLSLPPLLWAMLCWLAWEERGERHFYLGSLGLFLVAMLAKTSGVMLPVVFLGYAWWKRGAIGWRDMKATTPFFALAIVAGLLTLSPPQALGATEIPAKTWDICSALASVGWSVLFLLGKSLLPIDLLPVYHGFSDISPGAADLFPWVALGGLFCLLWLARAGWARDVLFGLGFFLVNLVPVLGYIFLKYSTMVWSMDHLLYLPVIGLIGLGVAGLGYLSSRLAVRWRVAGRMLVAGVVMLTAWSAHAQAAWFVTSDVFWNNLLRHDPDNWMAQLNLGALSLSRHRYAEAIPYFERVARLRPDIDDSHYNLGLALDKTGQTDQALGEFREALALNPVNPGAYLNLGEIMRRRGDLAEAESLFRRGLQAAPNDIALDTDLGGILLQNGRGPEAIAFYGQAVAVAPDVAQLQYNLGIALLQTGNVPEAARHLAKALTLDPKMALGHRDFGVALARLGHLPEAIEEFEAALQLNPDLGDARDNLGLALARTGHLSEASDQFRRALQLDPQDEKARESLARLRQAVASPDAARH
jgi:Flp pilus assembly protein TadD